MTQRYLRATIAGLALLFGGVPAVAFDPVSTAIIVGAVGNFAATVLDNGVPALQADRQRQQYIFETVELLERGQARIRTGQLELAQKLDELGDRVPDELRAELDDLVEDQTMGLARVLISDMKRVTAGGTPLISPTKRLNTLHTAVATYMERRSAEIGLGVPAWALTVELAFMEASREVLIDEYERRTGRPLASIEESYRSRVREYFAYFARAFNPREGNSARERLDQERAVLMTTIREIEENLAILMNSVEELPNSVVLDRAIRHYRPSVRIGISCGLDGEAFESGGTLFFHQPRLGDNPWTEHWKTLSAYLKNHSLAIMLQRDIEKALKKVRHQAQISRLLMDELKRVRMLFGGLLSVTLQAGHDQESVAGLGIDDEMMNLLTPPAELAEEEIEQTLARADATMDAARMALEMIGPVRRRAAERRRAEVGRNRFSRGVNVSYYCIR